MTGPTRPIDAPKTEHTGARPGEATYQSTRVVATFHSDEGFDGVVDSTPYRGPAGLLGRPFRILGLDTSKGFGGQPGTWTLTVKPMPGVDVMRIWRDPEDVWVRIAVSRNGQPTELLLGLINTITEDMVRDPQGARAETYTIHGLDWHKVLTSTQLYINIHENAGVLPVIPLYDAVAKNLIGPPDFILRTVIEAWLGNNGVADKQWRLPRSLGGGYFFDKLELDFEAVRGKIFDPALYSPDQMMGRSLWDTLEEYSNGLLNELYADMHPGGFFDRKVLPRPRLTLRERPFPTKDNGNRAWDALPTHTLNPGDIKGRQVSKGAPESRFNFWMLDAKGLLGDGLGVQAMIQKLSSRDRGVPGSGVIYSMEDIRKHGFRRFMQSTRFFPFREDPQWYTHSARWLQMLHDWYVVVPYELSGTLSCTGVYPNIRVGHRVIEERPAGPSVMYYVENVTHSWRFPGPGLTTLHVTRGEYEDENLLDLAYSYVIQAIDPQIEAALLQETALASEVPHGSGPRLDKAVGQVDTPERLVLKRRTGLEDQQHIRRGEPQSLQEGAVRELRPTDLPDQQIGLEAEILVGNAQPRPKTQGGALTQYELEAGTRLPTQGEGAVPEERATETTDQALARWRKKSGGV